MRNPAFPVANDDYYVQEKKFLLNFVPNGPNVVMDLGCGAGRFGRGLLESNKAAEVVGVEVFEPAAMEARKYYRTVHVGDIELLELPYRKEFDVVICGDVLEHLKEPSKVIEQARHWLKDGGRIVCCVPNVRYWRIWRDLVLRGEWKYVSEGIMDQTHLRFFTRRSFRRLLAEASFVVQQEGMRIARGPKQELFNRLTFGAFQEFLGIQMLFAARKA
jgi:2-polyprenyl-3-methyl-5-hydroxy-6-metoxy-1,4-benzoquinol methylase